MQYDYVYKWGKLCLFSPWAYELADAENTQSFNSLRLSKLFLYIR